MSDIIRKLASIRIVSEIRPIEGADNIELAIIDGWQVVVKKGEFQPNSWCVYFEIDSFLPVHPLFEFLRASSYRDIPELGQGFRLKTIRLRKQLSQGLALPISILNQFGDYYINQDGWVANFPENYWTNSRIIVGHHTGSDCTEYLGVKKFELPIPANLAGKVRGNFPSFIPKTDQERVQNVYMDDVTGRTYEVSMKLDGSSMTVYKKDDYIGICSRNMDLIETEENTFWKCANDRDIIEALRDNVVGNIALQGELMGPGIQGNPEGLTEYQFYLFDIYDIDARRYLLPAERETLFEFLAERCDFDHVPILFRNYSGENITRESALIMAEGPSMKAKNREGVVFKSDTDNFSFKAISNKFLLNEK